LRTFKYVLIYLLIIQFALYYIVPLDMVYGYRMDYDLVKDNIHNIDTVLEQISKEIKQKGLEDYIIILGDSVAFSGPGDSEQSIGFYLQSFFEKEYGGKARRVFNLSMPAMQSGDIYTMLLKLDKHGISTENLIFNVTYAGFVKRNPDPPSVFWLKDDLKNLDRQSFEFVQENLTANDYSPSNSNYISYMRGFLKNDVLPRLSLFQYKDFIKEALTDKKVSDALGDARVWSEKEGLRELLEGEEYQKGFSPEPFDMSVANPQVYFLDKILEHQFGKNTLVFLAATNEELMGEEVNKTGYRENLQRIDDYFQGKQVEFINLQGKIDESHFSDHIHLTAEGHRWLAERLYKRVASGW
jgi:hypothetical protein